MIEENSNIRDSVFQHIQEKILQDEWEPGDKLPPQDKLAEKLGISRSSLREALYRLSSLGLIEIKHGRGTYISSDISSSIADNLSLLMINEKDELALIEARIYLESGISALAAKRATAEEIDSLRDLVVDMEVYLKENKVEEFNQADFEFHLKIAEACKNPVLLNLVKSVRDLFQKQQEKTHLISKTMEMAYKYHKKIMQAIARRESEKASKLMIKHLKYVQDIYLEKVN